MDDDVFAIAKRHATQEGYDSVDRYIADVIARGDQLGDFVTETPDLGHLFTPEVIAEFRKTSASMKAGNYHTGEQVREHFRRKQLERKAKTKKAESRLLRQGVGKTR